MTAHKPIADPINLYDARNEDASELAPGAAVMEWAMSALRRTRAAARSEWSLLRVSSVTGIAIAAFLIAYFSAEFLR